MKLSPLPAIAQQIVHYREVAMTNLLDIESSDIDYNPDNLLDTLIQRLHLKNDAALSRALEVAPPVISKIRHRRLPVGASLLIRMYEISDMSIKELRELMGDRRAKFRISDKQFKPSMGGMSAHA
jgi:hypothetical protein